MVLRLAHLDHLNVDGALYGPKGGLRISYQTLDGHYLRSTPLVELIRSGYLGSRVPPPTIFRLSSVHRSRAAKLS